MASAWPYVNYIPHLGTVLHCLSADVVARYYRAKGEDAVLVSGSDEHGTPVEVEALKMGISPKQLTDRNHAAVVELFKKWGFSFDNYTRTENPVHKEFVQKHLMKIYNNKFIFTQETDMLYCERCCRFLQIGLLKENVRNVGTYVDVETNATPAGDFSNLCCSSSHTASYAKANRL